jgi:AraC-like DNA-binding protein
LPWLNDSPQILIFVRLEQALSEMTTLYIKNMVCDRCRTAVKGELDRNQIPYRSVELGEVEVDENTPNEKIQSFRAGIEQLGFELIDDKKSKTIEAIKAEIIKMIHNSKDRKRATLSFHLSRHLGKDYSTLTTLFSEVEGTTIEHYFINQKIERAKELLAYGELPLKEIAYQLGYSSVSHLSNQFKKVTGLTPGHFKNARNKMRKPLDRI